MSGAPSANQIGIVAEELEKLLCNKILSNISARELNALLKSKPASTVREALNRPPFYVGNSTHPTLLGLASIHGRTAVGEVLIRYGADVNANMLTEKDRQTALHNSEAMGHTEFSAMLREYGANEKALDSRGLTPKQRINDPELEQSRAAMSKMSHLIQAEERLPDSELPARKPKGAAPKEPSPVDKVLEGANITKKGKNVLIRVSGREQADAIEEVLKANKGRASINRRGNHIDITNPDSHLRKQLLRKHESGRTQER